MGSTTSIYWSGGCFSWSTPMTRRPILIKESPSTRPTPLPSRILDICTTYTIFPDRRLWLYAHSTQSSRASAEPPWTGLLLPPVQNVWYCLLVPQRGPGPKGPSTTICTCRCTLKTVSSLSWGVWQKKHKGSLRFLAYGPHPLELRCQPLYKDDPYAYLWCILPPHGEVSDAPPVALPHRSVG